MNLDDIAAIRAEVDHAHRSLAGLSLSRRQGLPTAVTESDVLSAYDIVTHPETVR
ncbi:MAG: hypothetical protein V2B18_01035 [Pseudomonadota bacterium]